MISSLGDALPSEADLDAMRPLDWPELHWPTSIDITSVDAGTDAPRKRRKSVAVVDVGDAPESVHAVAVAMWESGELQVTSAEQRRRNGRLPGINYGTPSRYTELLQWGFIGPNLPPPTGYRWRCRPGEWSLLSLGG